MNRLVMRSRTDDGAIYACPDGTFYKKSHGGRMLTALDRFALDRLRSSTYDWEPVDDDWRPL